MILFHHISGRVAALVVCVSALLGCGQQPSGGDRPLVLPVPAAMEIGQGSLRLDDRASFHLTLPDSLWSGYRTALDHPPPIAALDATGMDGLVRELALRGGLDPEVTVEIGGGTWRLEWGSGPSIEAPAERQAYRLETNPRGLSLAASDAPGFFYGVQTLRQLFRPGPPRFPAVIVDDAPAYPNRGVLIDITRGRVPTLDALRDLVDGLAEAKLNLLMLYIEFAFAFPSHPDIGRGMGQLAPDEARALVEYARARHVEVVPALQTLGHSSYLLHLPAYEHLAEDPDAEVPWMLSPALDETYDLVGDLITDLLAVFDAPHFNICGDESRRLGQNRSRRLMERMGRGGIFARHVGLLDRILDADGRRTLFFADILKDRPEVLRALPDDAILLNWHYLQDGPIDRDRYPLSARIAAAGHEQWVCPSISDWTRIYADLPLAIRNIAGFADDGLANGATGLLVTSWGDHGGENLLAGAWYGFLFAAEQAWRPAPEVGASYRDSFHRRLAWHRYRLDDPAIADAMWALGESNTPFRFWYGHNRSRNHDFFFRHADAESLVASIYSPRVRRAKARAVEAAAERARLALGAVTGAPPAWEERLNADRQFAEHALVRTEMAAAIAALLADEGKETGSVLAGRWEALARRYTDLMMHYRELWLREARPESFGWLRTIEPSYEAAIERCLADAARLYGTSGSEAKER